METNVAQGTDRITLEWKLRGNKIIGVKTETMPSWIPVENVEDNLRPEIEEHLKKLLELGVRIDLGTFPTVVPIEERPNYHDRLIEGLCEYIRRPEMEDTRKFILSLRTDKFISSSEICRQHGWSTPLKIAGIRSGITKAAKRILRELGMSDEEIEKEVKRIIVVRWGPHGAEYKLDSRFSRLLECVRGGSEHAM